VYHLASYRLAVLSQYMPQSLYRADENNYVSASPTHLASLLDDCRTRKEIDAIEVDEQPLIDMMEIPESYRKPRFSELLVCLAALASTGARPCWKCCFKSDPGIPAVCSLPATAPLLFGYALTVGELTSQKTCSGWLS
jgi:hypothetical protein